MATFNERIGSITGRFHSSISSKQVEELASELPAPTWTLTDITTYSLPRYHHRIGRIIGNRVFMFNISCQFEQKRKYEHYVFNLDTQTHRGVQTTREGLLFTTNDTEEAVSCNEQDLFYLEFIARLTKKYVYHQDRFHCFQSKGCFVVHNRQEYFHPKDNYLPHYFLVNGVPHFYFSEETQTEIYHARSMRKVATLPFHTTEITSSGNSIFCLSGKDLIVVKFDIRRSYPKRRH